MSTISASTTSTTAYKVTADTTGTLVLQTGSTPTTAVTIGSDQKVTFAYPPTATGGGSISTNTAYGTSALVANTTGSNQAAFGYQAGYTQTTADRNTMVGAQAGYAATNGSANAYFGFQAGYGNTTGYLGVAVGAYALAATSTGYQNTAVGAYALTASTGNYNVAVGKDSGLALTTGSYNTFAGPGAGYAMTTGSSNVIIGAFGGNSGGLDIRTASNNIVISDGSATPKLAYVQSDGGWVMPNFLSIGDGLTRHTNVMCYVKGTDAGSSNYGFYAETSGGTRTFSTRNDGYISTGLAANSPYNATIGLAANLHVYASDGGLYRATSSIKYKRDVENYTKGLDAVATLRPVFYKGVNPIEGETVYAGFIAEEVHEAGFTEFVQYSDDGTPDALSYGNMVSLCIKAIQELKAELDAAKAEIATLKGAA